MQVTTEFECHTKTIPHKCSYSHAHDMYSISLLALMPNAGKSIMWVNMTFFW